jgi:hypothetical protein
MIKSLLTAKIGDYRYVKKFLFFPKVQSGKLFWLENVTVRQLYTDGIGLSNIPRWVDICISNPDTGMPIEFETEKSPNLSIEITKTRFIDCGVNSEKIYCTENLSICMW